ncbi:unnamed protein product [Leptidea sinapis]|uniref:CCHC-type domain-containing protein n=1 Tax=Leptidea sinapis TaxID=189913 RepID=A0A5E4Q4U6_9NEOP|nr:unnamed protein product [Leptidea sinapis]
MDRFLNRSSSIPNLATKRPREDLPTLRDQWQQPKKFATSKNTSEKGSETEISNRFNKLPVDDGVTDTFKKASHKKSPMQVPPILIELLGDWSCKKIKDVIEKYEKSFHLQIRGRNIVKVQCYSTQGRQRLKEGLSKENVVFHTFSRKEEKLPKAVIKGLPKFIHDTLPTELASLGFAGITMTEMKTLRTTECPPLLIQLPTGSDIRKFKQIKYIQNCVVSIEKYKPKNKTGTQCFRCQDFGHASKNCNRPPRCVKCPLAHPTWECPKTNRDDPAHCCNSKQSHPANYSQCPARLKYLDRIQTQREKIRSSIVKTADTPLITCSQTTPSWAQITGKQKAQRVETHTVFTEVNHGPMDSPQQNSKQTSSVLHQIERQKSSRKSTIMGQNHDEDIKNEFSGCKTFME